MAELTQALTEFLRAATVWLEKQNGRHNPVPVGADAVAPVEKEPETKAPPKPRTPKKDKVPAGEEELTEEQSSKAATDTAKALVAKFPAMVDGKIEGFLIAKRLLIDTYQVGRMQDLSHEGRLKFIAEVKKIIAAGVNPFAAAENKNDLTGL